ncbi:erythromycin esterase family protein [Kitasatospora sp. NPDC018619]|uniref:erythromycin esterase family protein n=1 Tax=unclassified Kitasatospora TaxID=2633591 RepID=UPI0037A7DC57
MVRGLRIDDDVQGRTGGDARQLVKDAMGRSPWERREFADLIDRMRDHNRHRPGRRVHCVGDDLDLPAIDDRLFDRVTAYVREAAPGVQLPQLEQLYAGLRPFDGAIGYLTSVRSPGAAATPPRRSGRWSWSPPPPAGTAAGTRAAATRRTRRRCRTPGASIARTFAFSAVDPGGRRRPGRGAGAPRPGDG